ncbi:MAG: tetratricopeptide repeat protein [Pyrinomonadaceae bacterium]|nr:tetratricopeptide repeat protein [Pyrinomonadaceae bacterium]
MKILNLSVFLIIFLYGNLTPAQNNIGTNPTEKSGQTVKEKNETEKWREDLQFLASELPKRHKNAFHTMTREQFEKAIKDLDAKIPNLTRNQIMLEFARIVSMVQDGHTGLWLPFAPEANFHALPVKFYLFKEGLFIQSAAPKNANIVGGKVLKIGNVTAEKAIETVGEYVPRDNIYGIKNTAPTYLIAPEILQAIGFIKDPEKVDLLIEKEGKQFTVQLKPAGLFSNLATAEARKGWINARDNSKNLTPLWLKNSGNPFWFEYVPETKILYVQLNQVLNKQDETVEAFFGRVSEELNKNEVEKFVLDLRLNGGGNNGLVPNIIRAIVKTDKIDKKGKLFVIIGRQTFSAAQNLVNELEKYTKVTFVGEPTGSHVNLYGDARPIFLPNSKLRVNISSLWWQNMVELDKRPWTSPQVSAQLSFADYSNNIDPAMQAILNYQPRPTMTELVRADFEAGNMVAVKAKLIEFRKDPSNEFVSVEAELNAAGYRLMATQRTAQALEIFKLNTELYPDSANVFDSYGEALANAGKREEAIKAYERALQLSPNYPSAVEALQKLKGN